MSLTEESYGADVGKSTVLRSEAFILPTGMVRLLMSSKLVKKLMPVRAACCVMLLHCETNDGKRVDLQVRLRYRDSAHCVGVDRSGEQVLV